MPVRSLKDGKLTLMDNAGLNVVIDIEEGDFSFTKHAPINVVRDRGVLSHARKANEQYFDISFSMMWQTLSTHLSTTPYDALTRTGGAAAWASVSPSGSSYAVGVIFEATDADTAAAENDVLLFRFYPEEIEASEGDEFGNISVSGVGYLSLPFGADHEWLLNETSSTRYDNIGSVNLEDVNTPGSATGVEGLAADFEGSPTAAKQILRATSPLLVRGTAFTLMAFIKPESFDEGVKYCLCHSYDLNLRFVSGVPEVFGQDAITTAVGTTTLSAGTWYSAGMVYNGTTIWPVINGIKEGSGGAVAGSGTFNDPGNGYNQFNLGHINGGDGNYYWDGLIDVVMMWKTKALSDTELLAYHNFYA